MAPQYPQLSRRSFCERDDSALQWLQKLREYLWTLYCISIVDVLECLSVLFIQVVGGGEYHGIAASSVRQAVSQYHPLNFRGTVLGCIESDFCKQILNTHLNSYLVRKEIEKKGYGERLKNENLKKKKRSNNVHTQRTPLQYRVTLHRATRTTLASFESS